MKKILTLVLVLVLAVSAMFVFTACNNEPEEPAVVETFYNVKYVYKNGDKTTELSTQKVSDIAGFTAEQIAALENVKNDGYGFSGWFADEDCTVPFDFTQKPTADVTVYASRGNLAGDNVEWFMMAQAYGGEVGFYLFFNGEGALYDYDKPADAPWAAFADKIMNVSFSNGITRIGKNSFANCTMLDNIYITGTIKSIGEYAFYNCTGLSDFVIAEGVKNIEKFAFANCAVLDNVVIPGSVITIGENAFSACTGLKTFTMNEGVKYVEKNVFTDDAALATLTIPASLEKIDHSALYGTIGLTEVVVAEEAKNFKFVENCLIDVANKTLIATTVATTVTVDESVKVIARGAFYGKTTLTTVYLPETLVEIGESAFSNCTKLANVLIAEKDALLLNNTAVVVEIPDSVEVIGKSAFNKCTAIKGAVYLGNKITEISDAIFFGCKSITNVIVPATVTNIGATAFKDCSGLKHVFFKGTEEQFNAITCGVDNYTFVDMAVKFFYKADAPTVAGPYWYNAGEDKDGKDLGIKQWAFSIHYKTAPAYSSTTLKYIFTDYVMVDQETYKATYTEANQTFRDEMKVDGFTYLDFDKYLYTLDGTTKKWNTTTANIEFIAYRTQGISDGGGIQLTYSGTTATVKLHDKFDEETMSDKTWDFANLAATQFLWKTKDASGTGSNNKVGPRRDTIVKLTLNPGIKYYGAYSLASFAIDTLVIPADVESVHYTFVDNSTKLKTIYYQGTEALKVVDSEGKEVALNQPGVTIYTKYVEGSTDVTKNGAYWTEIGGKKLVWNFQDGALTIGGDAVMVDFEAAADAPWAEANITSVAFDAGITKIGENILNGDESVATIKLPSSVRIIPANAFAGTAAIKNLAAAADGCGYIDGHLIKVVDATKIGARFDIPRGTYSVAEGAFDGVTALKQVYVIRGVGYIAADAFDGTNLETVYFDGLPAAWKNIVGEDNYTDVDIYYATLTTPTLDKWVEYNWFTIETEPDKSTGFRKITTYTEEDYVTVTFKADKADAEGTEVVYIDGLGGAISVAAPTKAGYTFNGWADEAGNVYTKVTADLLKDGDATLVATWKK